MGRDISHIRLIRIIEKNANCLQEFQAHKKQGKGIISHVTDSIHNMGASYMMKNRPAEFALMHEYINIFGDKLGVMDRIATRVLREQAGWLTFVIIFLLILRGARLCHTDIWKINSLLPRIKILTSFR